MGVCPASLLELLFHGLTLSPPVSAGGWRSRAAPEGPQRAPKLCPGCTGRNQVLQHRWAAAISQDIGIHIHKQDSKRQTHPWCLWSLSCCFSISRRCWCGLSISPPSPALLPEPPVLPQPSTSTLAGMQGGFRLIPSVARGAAQEQSANHSVPQCQQCLSEPAGCLPGFKCCHFSADPTTYRDENLSTGVVRKSLFFRVSTWCIALTKAVFY